MKGVIAQIVTNPKTTQVVNDSSVYLANALAWFSDVSHIWIPIVCSSVYTLVRAYAILVKIQGQRTLNRQFQKGEMDNETIRKLKQKLKELES